MKKTFSIFVILLFLCPLVFGDGMIHIYDMDMWRLGSEDQQLVAINHQDGFENMLISVDIGDDVEGEKAVWIFPVPSAPDQVEIDILKGYPNFRGKDIDSQFNDVVGGVAIGMVAYSTFPLPFFMFPLAYFGVMNAGRFMKTDGIMLHQKIEKMGLTTELITTKDAGSLGQYLHDKGLDMPEESVQILEGYIGKDYSFVVSYINDLARFKQERQTDDDYRYGREGGIPIGVFVRFPTEKIYFPLKPTSVYGSKEIPILIYVIGHVTPKLYPEIKDKTEMTYFELARYRPESHMQPFFNGKTEMDDLKYTKIKINAPSERFKEDLWIKDRAPILVSIKSFLASIFWLWGIIMFVIISMVSSLLAGIVSFRKDPLPRKKLMLHGLWNCLTFIGLFVATILINTRKIDPRLQEQLESQGLKVSDTRKVVYTILFYVFFIGLVVAFSLLSIFIF
mgnify:CR=1 FL=1